MAKTINDDPLLALKKSIDTLILIELVKAGANRDQIRKIVGSVNNNTISAINVAMGRSAKSVRNDKSETEE